MPRKPDSPESPTPPRATPILQIDAGKVTGKVSPELYGLMTEEINFSYEGGIYGELIRNRTFKSNTQNPAFWNTVGEAAMTIDTNQPLNGALKLSLKLDASKASKTSPVGIANGGFWGIPVKPNTVYRASFYARGKKFSGPLNLSLESADGKTVFASATISKISGKWKKYEATLKTGRRSTLEREPVRRHDHQTRHGLVPERFALSADLQQSSERHSTGHHAIARRHAAEVFAFSRRQLC